MYIYEVAKNITTMIYNILNGDSLAYSFPDTKIEGDMIVLEKDLLTETFQEMTCKTSGTQELSTWD